VPIVTARVGGVPDVVFFRRKRRSCLPPTQSRLPQRFARSTTTLAWRAARETRARAIAHKLRCCRLHQPVRRDLPAGDIKLGQRILAGTTRLTFTRPLRVILADDQEIVRRGIKLLLQREMPDMQIVAEAPMAGKRYDWPAAEPDVAILDLAMRS